MFNLPNRPNEACLSNYAGVLAVTVRLCACASIPFSTMWKMRSFSRKDLKTLEPGEICIIAGLTDWIKMEPDKTTLSGHKLASNDEKARLF